MNFSRYPQSYPTTGDIPVPSAAGLYSLGVVADVVYIKDSSGAVIQVSSPSSPVPVAQSAVGDFSVAGQVTFLPADNSWMTRPTNDGFTFLVFTFRGNYTAPTQGMVYLTVNFASGMDYTFTLRLPATSGSTTDGYAGITFTIPWKWISGREVTFIRINRQSGGTLTFQYSGSDSEAYLS